MKRTIIGIFGLIGGLIASLYGGWTAAMTTLLIFMGADILSGTICAGVFGASEKTESGGLSSKVGFRGLCKKCMIMLFVLIGARMDSMLGVSYLKDAVCIAFCANELLSITENAAMMGLPVPDVLTRAIDILRKGHLGDHENDEDDGDDAQNNA